MANAPWISAVLLLISAALPPFVIRAQVRTVRGSVYAGTQPVSDAVVRVQGGTESTKTDDKGTFRLQFKSPAASAYVTAWHEGFYSNRVRWNTQSPVSIDLRALPAADNTAYQWKDPAPHPGNDQSCGNCHARIYSEWTKDAHSISATNPMVVSLYQGTDVAGHVNRGPGYKRDWGDEGDCASCHAPIAYLKEHVPVRFDQVKDIALLGVDCEVCHKMSQVPENVALPTIADVRFLRPPEGARLNFGPFDDSTFPGEVPDFAYSSLFEDSKLCASCHEGRSWGVPIYSTYSEWKDGPYSTAGVQCQGCHMKAAVNDLRFANANKGGIARTGERLHLHDMTVSTSPGMLKDAIAMKTLLQRKENVVTVTVTIENTGAGHDYPTGQPMRNLILLVTAVDETGTPLTLLAGDRVPAWGGNGGTSTDYAGRPGKGFARVLQTLNEYQKPTMIAAADAQADFPAPAWRRNRIISDNRLLQGKPDISTWLFLASPSGKATSVVTTLIYRKAFKPLADLKGWDLSDLVIAANRSTL